jgi:hypothetical protein
VFEAVEFEVDVELGRNAETEVFVEFDVEVGWEMEVEVALTAGGAPKVAGKSPDGRRLRTEEELAVSVGVGVGVTVR